MKYKFGFMLKTYRNDYPYAIRLIQSYHRYNVDNIPCFVVLPTEDIEEFENALTPQEKKNVICIPEESCPYLISKPLPRRKKRTIGYVNQEIIKLSFWEMNLCENYLCLDSDAIFIRKFTIEDFMHDEKTPYTVLIEDNELQTDSLYNRKYWEKRAKGIQFIKNEIGLTDKKTMTCHGLQIFSASVLEHFKKNYMDVKGHTYADLIDMSPYEVSWYNFWLQKSRCMEIYPCEPWFLVFHMKHQLIRYRLMGVTRQDIARGYVGVLVQSNFTEGEMLDYDNPKVIPLETMWKKICKYLISRE